MEDSKLIYPKTKLEFADLINSVMTVNNNYSNEALITVRATPLNNWRVFYDNNALPLILPKEDLSEDTIKEFNLLNNNI